MSILAAIALIRELAGFSTSFFVGFAIGTGMDLSEESVATYSIVALIFTVIIVVALYIILHRRFGSSLEIINKYAQNEEIPISFVVNTQNIQEGAFPKPNNNHNNETPNQLSKTELLFKIKELLDSGILTQEEFDNEKKKILNS